MRKTTRRALIMASLLTILTGGVAAFGLSGAAESWLFYFPSRRTFRDPPGVQAVTFKTADNLDLSAWFFPALNTSPAQPQIADSPTGDDLPDPSLPAADARHPTILVAHGNAGCLPDHDEFCSFLADHGFNVLLFDYRGYGRSDLPRRGLRRADLVLDTKAAFEYLLTRDDVDPDRIALLGYSLGGNIGLAFAAGEDRIRAVTTLSTYSRWKDVASDHGGPLGRFLIPEGLDAADSVTRLGDRPLLIIHGDDDDIVPFRHAALLEAAANAADIHVTRLDVPGADHLNMTQDKAVQQAIADFFTRALTPPTPDPTTPDPARTP